MGYHVHPPVAVDFERHAQQELKDLAQQKSCRHSTLCAVASAEAAALAAAPRARTSQPS